MLIAHITLPGNVYHILVPWPISAVTVQFIPILNNPLLHVQRKGPAEVEYATDQQNLRRIAGSFPKCDGMFVVSPLAIQGRAKDCI